MDSGWLTTVLILLPVAGALIVWILPLRPFWVGSTALLFALVEIAVWIDAVAQYDFSKPGPQLSQKTSWFSDLNVSYHVGLYGFSVWLVGLTVVVMAATIAYAFWAGRERPEAYFGLMLLLTGAIVGVFVAQDLLLFYVFWEAMLIPLYFLVGVWGGAGRLRATLVFVIYTMAGSLLMLASVIALGLSQGTFDMVGTGTNGSDWIFLGFVAAFAVKAPLFPFHGWLPEAYRESSPEVAAVLSGVISKAAAFGFLRIAIAKFPGPAVDFRIPILVLAGCGLIYGSLLAFRAPDLRGVIAYSSLAQMGLITFGLFAINDLGLNGAVLQMVNHGLISASLFLLAGGIERRAATGRARPARWHGARTAGPGDRADGARRDRARGARLGGLRGRVRDPGRGLPDRLGLGRRRRGRDRPRRDVHAPPDLGGAAQEPGPFGLRGRARPAPGRARDPRSAPRVPARAVVLAGRDHGALVRAHPVFGRDRARGGLGTPPDHPLRERPLGSCAPCADPARDQARPVA